MDALDKKTRNAETAQTAAAVGTTEKGGPSADAGSGKTGVTRRALVIGAASAAVLVGLGAIGIATADDGYILRPPGGQDPDHFLSLCLHCEKCREVCPHNAISPLGVERGIAAARTPSMDFYKGWCNFCEEANDGHPLCAQVCPTGALSLAGIASAKDDVVIGIARINRDWCLAWQNKKCRVCVDACPYDALEFDASERPVVHEDKCNGCGRCENVCISLTSASVAPDATSRAIVVEPAKNFGANGGEQA